MKMLRANGGVEVEEQLLSGDENTAPSGLVPGSCGSQGWGLHPCAPSRAIATQLHQKAGSC